MPAKLTDARKGRPPLPNGEGRRRLIGVAVNDREAAAFRAAAQKAGMPLSAWIRMQALGALR